LLSLRLLAIFPRPWHGFLAQADWSLPDCYRSSIPSTVGQTRSDPGRALTRALGPVPALNRNVNISLVDHHKNVVV
jgi:hypothetical protein